MSARRFERKAEREASGQHNGVCRGQKKHGRKTLNAGACSCHPPAWGLKKGLRRGRRRFSKIIIKREIEEDDVGQESKTDLQALQE